MSPWPWWSVVIELYVSFRPAALARAEARSSPWEVVFGTCKSFGPAMLAVAADELPYGATPPVDDDLGTFMYGAEPPAGGD